MRRAALVPMMALAALSLGSFALGFTWRPAAPPPAEPEKFYACQSGEHMERPVGGSIQVVRCRAAERVQTHNMQPCPAKIGGIAWVVVADYRARDDYCVLRLPGRPAQEKPRACPAGWTRQAVPGADRCVFPERISPPTREVTVQYDGRNGW